ncbi:hypothetical protein LCGC14_2433260, partial [marine sediment metagenome]
NKDAAENPTWGVLKAYREAGRRVSKVVSLTEQASKIEESLGKGKGKGNQFLSDLSRASVLIHVVDVSGSTNEKGEPVPMGSHNPEEDVAFLEEEIDLTEIINHFEKTLKNIKPKIKKMQMELEELTLVR